MLNPLKEHKILSYFISSPSQYTFYFSCNQLLAIPETEKNYFMPLKF